MAGQSTSEVRVAVDGIVSTAPYSTSTPPTSSASTLAAPWVDLGYVSEDGVTEATAQSSEKIRAWQKGKAVRTVITEGETTYQLVLIQTNKDTVALYYGADVASDGSIVVNPMKERPLFELNLDVIDGTDIVRAYAPEAQVTEVGDQVYANGVPIGYEVTITCAVVNDVAGSGKPGSVKKWYSSLAATAVPTITSALPASQTTGEVVTLVGTGFSGVTGITIGGVAATGFDVISATKIYITLPSGTAGSAPIIVTTSAGASTAKAYTRA